MTKDVPVERSITPLCDFPTVARTKTEKRICAQCTASSQERNFRDTRKSVRSAHKWTEDVSQLQDHHPEKQQPTDTLETFLGLSDSSTSSDSSNRAPSGLLWRCFHVGGRLRWGSLSSYLSDHLWFCLEAHSFCFL